MFSSMIWFFSCAPLRETFSPRFWAAAQSWYIKLRVVASSPRNSSRLTTAGFPSIALRKCTASLSLSFIPLSFLSVALLRMRFHTLSVCLACMSLAVPS